MRARQGGLPVGQEGLRDGTGIPRDLAVSRFFVPANRMLRREIGALNRVARKRCGRNMSYGFLQDLYDPKEIWSYFGSPNFPQVFMDVGMRAVRNRELRERIVESGEYRSYLPCGGMDSISPSFIDSGLTDLGGILTACAVVPFIIWFDERRLGDRPAPRSWEDLLDPIWHGDITVDNARFLGWNPVFALYRRLFGMGGVDALLSNMASTASNVTSAINVPANMAAVHVTAWCFIQCRTSLPYIHLVWPQEGAAVSPVLMLARGELDEMGETAVDYFLSERFATIVGRDCAPAATSVDDGICRRLFENVGAPQTGRYQWPSWDQICNTDFGKLDEHIVEYVKMHPIEGM